MFRFNPTYVNRYLPKIISYLPLEDSSTLYSHIKIFIALNLGKVEYILTLILVVIFPACVCHYTTLSYLLLILVISLIIKILELYPLFNKIRKLLNFDLPLLVFMHKFRIEE